jgi:glutamyl-tRNA reductase
MNMRRADKTLIMLAVCLLALSCASGCKINAGADVPLVTAERTQGVALDTIQAIWRIDNDNRQAMRDQLPRVHDWIEQSRREFPPAYQQADDAIAAYRAAKTAGNQESMNTALEKIEQMASVARRYLAEAHAKGITPKTRSTP